MSDDVPVIRPVKVERTERPDGRVDVTVIVPRVSTRAQAREVAERQRAQDPLQTVQHVVGCGID